MYADIKEGLEALFKETLALQFARKTYETNFKNVYEKHKELFAHIIEECEKSENREETIEKIAGIVPDYLKTEMDKIPSKRKKEGLQIDYNATVVTYVLPLLTYTHNEACEAIADLIVEKWNETESSMKIKRASFEEIQGGFKSRLCYVTTAVCQSLNKEDDCYELNLLRDYRDDYLVNQRGGEEIVRKYYDIAPTIVKRISRLEHAAEVYQDIWKQYLSPCITLIENDQREKCREIYTKMVNELQQRYIYS